MNIYTLVATLVSLLSLITIVGWIVATQLDKRFGTERGPANRFEILYSSQATMPQRLKDKASEIGITPEQLIKVLISQGMEKSKPIILNEERDHT